MSTTGKTLPPRARDLTGMRFGNLVVEERAGSNSAGNATWWCRCDCGTRTRTVGTDLRRGRSVSCGCQAIEKTKRRYASARAGLVGYRTGKLTVVSFAGMNAYPRATWLCRCDCGNEITVSQHHLRDGTTVSCGCRAGDPRPGAVREVVLYQSAHGRVKQLRGAASLHPCIDCGGSATDWSYDHGDMNELTDERGRPYSVDPSYYHPRCRPCHKRFDNDFLRNRAQVKQEGERA